MKEYSFIFDPLKKLLNIRKNLGGNPERKESRKGYFLIVLRLYCTRKLVTLSAIPTFSFWFKIPMFKLGGAMYCVTPFLQCTPTILAGTTVDWTTDGCWIQMELIRRVG